LKKAFSLYYIHAHILYLRLTNSRVFTEQILLRYTIHDYKIYIPTKHHWFRRLFLKKNLNVRLTGDILNSLIDIQKHDTHNVIEMLNNPHVYAHRLPNNKIASNL